MARQEDMQFTPVRSRRGKIVHAARYDAAQKTACGVRMRGWVVASARAELDCPGCLLALWIDCRSKKEKARAKRAGRQKRVVRGGR